MKTLRELKTKKLCLLFSLLIPAIGFMVIGPQRLGRGQTPSPSWSQQFGTTVNDCANGVTTDNVGNLYVVGYTGGNLFGTSAGGDNVFVAKYNPSGAIVWSKQFGTSQDAIPADIAIDSGGNVYVGGATGGALFDSNGGEDDAFLVKFDANGNQLWGKQFGTSAEDELFSMTLDSQGNVFAVGSTQGSLFGSNTGPDNAGNPVENAFIVKFDTNGNQLWGQQFGADDANDANGVAVDSQGNAFVVGSTEVGNVKQLFGPVAGISDAYIAKFSSAGTLLWGKQFGTANADGATAVSVDGNGNAFVVGNMGVVDTDATSGTAFIAKFDTSGNQFWLNPIGAGDINPYSVACDAQGNTLVTGDTSTNLFGPNAGGQDAFLGKYDTSGNLLWGQQFGTSNAELAKSVATDNQGYIYVAGGTSGSLFGTNAGGEDAYLAKFSPGGQITSSLKRRSSPYRSLLFVWAGLPANLLYPPLLIGSRPYMYVGYLSAGVPGAKVSYTQAKQIVIDNERNRQVVVSTNALIYRLNGQARTMAAKPVMVNGHCYVPLDVAKVVMPFPVRFDAKARTVRFDPPRPKQARK